MKYLTVKNIDESINSSQLVAQNGIPTVFDYYLPIEVITSIVIDPTNVNICTNKEIIKICEQKSILFDNQKNKQLTKIKEKSDIDNGIGSAIIEKYFSGTCLFPGVTENIIQKKAKKIFVDLNKLEDETCKETINENDAVILEEVVLIKHFSNKFFCLNKGTKFKIFKNTFDISANDTININVFGIHPCITSFQHVLETETSMSEIKLNFEKKVFLSH